MGESPISHRSVPWTAVTNTLLRSDLGSEKRDFRIFRLFWGAQTPNKGHRHRLAQPPARSGGEQPLVSMRIFVWPRCPPLFCPRSGVRGMGRARGGGPGVCAGCGDTGCMRRPVGHRVNPCRWRSRVATSAGKGRGIVFESYVKAAGVAESQSSKHLKSLKNSLQ